MRSIALLGSLLLLLTPVLVALTGQRGLLATELTAFRVADPKVGTPSSIVPGVPYIVRDGNGTQVCISSRGGHPVPPFIVPDTKGTGFHGSDRLVQPWLPFVVQDGYSTQVCISSRGGHVWPPFVVR